MDRRDFLKAATASALGAQSGATALVMSAPAVAQSRRNTLLVVSENAPNNFDVQGLGTNRPGTRSPGIAMIV